MNNHFAIKKSSITTFVLSFWGLWYVFLNASVSLRPMYSYLWPLVVLIALLFNINAVRERYSNLYIIYGLLVVACLFSLIFTQDMSASLEYIKRLVLAIGFAVAITATDNSEDIIIRIMEFFSIVMLVISFSQYLLPSVYTGVFLPLCSQHDSLLVTTAIQSGEAVGLTNGTSQNGLFMAIGFVLFACKSVCKEKNRIINITIAALFFGMTFATGKRSYSLICIILLIIIIYYISQTKKSGNRLISGLILCVVFVVTFSFAARKIPILNSIVQKFVSLSESGDVTNGRMILYLTTWNEFKKHIFTGIGIDAAATVLGGATHNSYLQWLVEFGIPIVSIPIITIFYIPVFKIKSIVLSLKETSNGDAKYKMLCSFIMTLMILFSGLVAVPFQWTNVFMIYMIMQLIILKKLHGRKEKQNDRWIS